MNKNTELGSLKRGVVLLKLLATGGARGCPLSELSEKSGMPHPSAHRILKQLIAERLVEHNRETHRYKLGPLAFELGIAGSTMHDIRDLCEPTMQAMALETEDTVYLVVRSGFEAVCMHRWEGSFPIRTLVLEVGSRRPLGVGAGGLAVLAAIEEDEREEIIRRVAPSLPAFGKLTPAALAEACDTTRAHGVAIIQNRVSLGVTAVGAAFRDSMGLAIGAVSVAALSQRMGQARLRKISELVLRGARDIEASIRRQRAPVKAGKGARMDEPSSLAASMPRL
ncbi:IclR family transcriptional regulator [Ottowia thiooxydans]|uniref:IclR family transcriptional regulator n=1 Tax=Ottowia thiooxydans TaxID=219182 RepID=UPI000A02902C|nr:IclR family transcriptional regulator [Ottowia thiooxydans]